MPSLITSALISDCGFYRYRLGRRWGDGEIVGFVMLNPSTADAEKDDPTIRRCIGFAKQWGFDGIEVVNLFAYRATFPSDLIKAVDPIGPDNDQHIRAVASTCRTIVAAWGQLWHGFETRGRNVAAILEDGFRKLKCLGVTKDGFPKHPLYLRKDTLIVDFKEPCEA